MAAHIGQPTRSPRFIRAYLVTWAMLAIGALGYLTTLALQPQAAPPRPQVADTDSGQSIPAMSKALAEVRTMRGSLNEIRKDVTQLQDAVGERAAQEKAVQSRLTVLEERVAGTDTSQPTPMTAPIAKAPDKAPRKTLEPHTTADILARAQGEAAQPPAPKADAPPGPLETGSIKPAAEITFGEAIVTPARPTFFAVQLGAGPSLEGLRQSWGELVERHSGSLATLQPRVVPPRAEGGSYRLLAGPVPTKADADRVCTELGVGRKGCFATAYAGQPL